MVTLNVRSIPRHRGTRTVVRFSDAFACAHMCAWMRVRVRVCLCDCALFVNPRHRGTSNSLISAEALCMCVRRCGFAFVSFSLSLGTAISVILAALWCFQCLHACAGVLVRVHVCACARVFCSCSSLGFRYLIADFIRTSGCVRLRVRAGVRARVCVCMKRVAECSPIHSDIISDQKPATNGQTDGRTDVPSYRAP